MAPRPTTAPWSRSRGGALLASPAAPRPHTRRAPHRVQGDFFDLIDTDKSGALSVAELEATMAVLAGAPYNIDVATWVSKEQALYSRMSLGAWGRVGVPKKQLPHLGPSE